MSDICDACKFCHSVAGPVLLYLRLLLHPALALRMSTLALNSAVIIDKFCCVFDVTFFNPFSDFNCFQLPRYQ